MTKIVLDDNSTNLDPLVFNENFRKIEKAFNEDVLYRQNPIGEPNELVNHLDLNGYKIYNLPYPLGGSEPFRKSDADDMYIEIINNIKGEKGEKGEEGDSAYQVAVNEGFIGTEAEWLDSLTGPKGDQGVQGEQGVQGDPGIQGIQGIQGEQGEKGEEGDSAYQVALTNGFIGTEAQWLDSLVGPQGDQGIQGEKGETGDTGPAGTANASSVAVSPILGLDSVNVQDALTEMMEIQGWSSKAVGEPFPLWDDIPGVPLPPTNNPGFRFIKLTASDAYNSGVLVSESVSGSAPKITATAVISLAGSPINGQTVSLINTERTYLRPGTSGALQDDQFSSHSHTGSTDTHPGHAHGGGMINSYVSQFNMYGGGSYRVAEIGGTGAAGAHSHTVSTVAVGGSETTPRNRGASFYMRIL